MGAASLNQARTPKPLKPPEYRRLRSECWEQLLNLLSARPFYLKAEYWPAFTELVHWHHILIDALPVLRHSAQCHEFDSAQLDLLDRACFKLRRKALSLCQTQNLISRHFSDTGIRHLFFKGIALSQWLYGSTTARQCRDMDVIVHPADHAIACSQLEKIGCKRVVPRAGIASKDYHRYCSAMKDVSYHHTESNSIIELHWALRPFPEAFVFDFDNAYESRKVVEVEGTDIPVFPDLLHTGYIAAHGCLSHWGRLRWLLDWQQLCLTQSIDWQALHKGAATPRESDYIQRAFLLANQQLGLATPAPFDTCKAPLAAQYCLRKQSKAQSQAGYPGWLSRQILNLVNQGNLAGMSGYGRYMIKKLIAAKTLK